MSRMTTGWFKNHRNLNPSVDGSPFQDNRCAWFIYLTLCEWAAISDQTKPLPLSGHRIKQGEVLFTQEKLTVYINQVYGHRYSLGVIKRAILFLEKNKFIEKRLTQKGKKKLASIYMIVPFESEEAAIPRTTNVQLMTKQRTTKPTDIPDENGGSYSSSELLTYNKQPSYKKREEEGIKKNKNSNASENTLRDTTASPCVDGRSNNDFVDLGVSELVETGDVYTPDVSRRLETGLVVAEPIGSQVTRLVELWKEMYFSRYGAPPRMTGKERGILKKVIQDDGFQNAFDLLGSYLSMTDTFFVANGHTLPIFSLNLQVIQTFLLTGKVISKEYASALNKAKCAQEITDINYKAKAEEIERIIRETRRP